MQFSPFVLLRHPSYDLSRMDVFAIDLELEHSLEELVETKRKHFLSFIGSKDLLLSLPFSSRTVYQAIPHYEFHATVKIRKKEKQTERALTKYLGRMSLNASPLAAFAKSQFVDWEWTSQEAATNYHMSLSLTQRKEFFDLCYCDPGLQDHMRYRLNPSLRKNEQGFFYLFNEMGEESIIQLAADQQFEDLYNQLQLKDFTFREFVSQSDYDVNEFLDSQLIVPSYPIYDDIHLLKDVIASINDRHNLSFQIHDVAGISFDKLSDMEAIKQQKHWEQQINGFAKSLDVVLDHKLYLERAYYLNTYSQNDIKKPKINRELLSENIASLIVVVKRSLVNQNRNVLDLNELSIAAEIKEEKFDLNKVKVKQHKENLIELDLGQEQNSKRVDSFGVMLQFAGDKPALVNVSTPYAKFFAPSLNLVTPEVQDKIKAWVKEIGLGKVCIKDESMHNKNRAHAFIPELNAFGLNFNSPIADRVVLEQNVKGGLINAKDKSPVSLVNLGIEDFSTRSVSFQNLNVAAEKIPNVAAFISQLQVKYSFTIDANVSSQPRVESNEIIHGYQKWNCLKEAFSHFEDPKKAYMKALNEWRKQYEIPRIVQFSIDEGKLQFLDFFNFWSVDTFMKLIRKMEATCTFMEMGIEEDIKGLQLFECYFEVNCEQ